MTHRIAAPVALPMLAALLMTAAGSAQASETIYQATSFMSGAQSQTLSYDFTTPGTLTITVSTPSNWLDSIIDPNCFFSTPSGIIGSQQNGMTDTVNIQPGLVSATFYGEAVGSFPFAAYSISIQFTPSTPVPLPGTLLALASGLGGLLLWGRRGARRQQAALGPA